MATTTTRPVLTKPFEKVIAIMEQLNGNDTANQFKSLVTLHSQLALLISMYTRVLYKRWLARWCMYLCVRTIVKRPWTGAKPRPYRRAAANPEFKTRRSLERLLQQTPLKTMIFDNITTIYGCNLKSWICKKREEQNFKKKCPSRQKFQENWANTLDWQHSEDNNFRLEIMEVTHTRNSHESTRIQELHWARVSER